MHGCFRVDFLDGFIFVFVIDFVQVLNIKLNFVGAYVEAVNFPSSITLIFFNYVSDKTLCLC